MKKYKGELALLFVAALWGTGFVTTAVVLEQFDTLMLGINNLDWQNPNALNMFNVGQEQEGFLPSTSIGN